MPRRSATKGHFVILTGLSGAGKSQAMRCFEDLGFFCVDNLPPTLIPKFAELWGHSDGRVRQVALVTDIRGGEFFHDLLSSLEELRQIGFDYRILFLDASEQVLVQRFKASRRRHPLSGRSLLDSIRRERHLLEQIKERADKVIDTSALPVRELKDELVTLFARRSTSKMLVSVISFGYKLGVPVDADLVFDLRFLRNPHYVPEFQGHNGHDPEVAKFVMEDPLTEKFLRRIYGLLEFSLPHYVREGKSYLTVALGCTGGRHRSVVLAEELTRHLRERGHQVQVEHRDLRR